MKAGEVLLTGETLISRKGRRLKQNLGGTGGNQVSNGVKGSP